MRCPLYCALLLFVVLLGIWGRRQESEDFIETTNHPIPPPVFVTPKPKKNVT